MISTFQALAVAVVAVLPGALYTIALENRGASWVWPRSDTGSQVIRFLGASAVFHAVFAPVSYWAYQQLIADRAQGGSDKHIALYWWPILLAYVVLPYIWGEWTVRSRSWGGDSCRVKRLIKWFIGLYTAGTPEPRAWDWLFSKPNLSGVVRLQLTTGEWKVGLWANSYASSYGEDGDLYMAEQYALTEAGGLDLDDQGEMRPLGVGLLIRWSEIRYLEFSELPVEAYGERSEDGEATCWWKPRSWKPGWWKPGWWEPRSWRPGW